MNAIHTFAERLAPATRLQRGRLLDGRYRVTCVIGRHGAVDVCLASDRILERDVVIEVLRPEIAETSAGVDAFHHAAIALAAVGSPYVVAVHDVGIGVDALYLVTEHVAGRTLADEVARRGPIEPKRAFRLASDLLEGIAELQRRWLVHRFVTPVNVLIDAHERAVLRLPPMLANISIAEPRFALSHHAMLADLAQTGAVLLFMLTGSTATASSSSLAALIDRPDVPRALRAALATAVAAIPDPQLAERTGS